MSKILISVVSHGQEHLVRQLLKSIEKFLIQGNHQVSIVITENYDDQINIEKTKFPMDTFQNLYCKGFGANHNDAFIKQYSDYFFIVNPDIILDSQFDINSLINFMETENVSISSPKIVSKSGALCDYKRSNLSPLNLLNRRLFNRKDSRLEWLAGMFLIVKSVDFKALSGFDTRYFMYVEDCDLCTRAREKDMKIMPFECISVIHDEQRASHSDLRHLLWHASSLIRYWRKRYWG